MMSHIVVVPYTIFFGPAEHVLVYCAVHGLLFYMWNKIPALRANNIPACTENAGKIVCIHKREGNIF